MVNTQGGTITLDVAEQPIGLVWEGVPDAAQLRSVLWGTTNDRHLPVNQLYPAHLSARGSSV